MARKGAELGRMSEEEKAMGPEDLMARIEREAREARLEGIRDDAERARGLVDFARRHLAECLVGLYDPEDDEAWGGFCSSVEIRRGLLEALKALGGERKGDRSP